MLLFMSSPGNSQQPSASPGIGSGVEAINALVGVQESVEQFFNSLSGSYDERIFKGVPPYKEMITQLFTYLFFKDAPPNSILELGCGTGLLSECLRQQFPHATLTLVDLSAEMLTRTQERFQKADNMLFTGTVHYVQSDFVALELPQNSFDLVVSSLALHHVLDEGKPGVYQSIYHWLKPGGSFRCADQCLAVPTPLAHLKNISLWEAWARQSGSSDEDITLWAEHSQKFDHYAPLANHFEWLANAGFTHVDCYWKKLFWTVFGAEKPLS
jgi:tRNA (cmo5U34)-methyltransferase